MDNSEVKQSVISPHRKREILIELEKVANAPTPEPSLTRLARLARTFPTFAWKHGTKCDAPGLGGPGEDFDGDVFAEHLDGLSSGERVAADFLLHVYNHYDYKFDLGRIGSWHKAHLAAFADWARDPFWA